MFFKSILALVAGLLWTRTTYAKCEVEPNKSYYLKMTPIFVKGKVTDFTPDMDKVKDMDQITFKIVVTKTLKGKPSPNQLNVSYVFHDGDDGDRKYKNEHEYVFGIISVEGLTAKIYHTWCVPDFTENDVIHGSRKKAKISATGFHE